MARKLTSLELNERIAKLQAQAAQAREAEKADVIDRMKSAIDYYGITAAELGLGKATKVEARKAATRRQAGVGVTAARVKYQDGAGHTWSGFGRRPRWFTEALESGRSVEELLA
jgi:DNA-binding protein H-NS